MAAAGRGWEAAMLAAQHAPIGARICPARAIRTPGRKFRNRRRIDQVHLFRSCELIMQGVRSRDRFPEGYALSWTLTARFLAWAPGNNLTLPVFLRGPPFRAFFEGPRPCRSAHLGGRMQPAVAKFRSFRRLLEF